MAHKMSLPASYPSLHSRSLHPSPFGPPVQFLSHLFITVCPLPWKSIFFSLVLDEVPNIYCYMDCSMNSEGLKTNIYL